MWHDKDLLDTIKMFLPSTSKIILFKTPDKRPAVELIDLDGDNILELVGAYYWHGEIYIIILKYYDSAWHVMDTVKGKGYNITYFKFVPITSKYKNNLVIGWQVGAIWSDLSVYELKDTKLIDLINGNKYFSMIEIAHIKGTKEKNGTHELALWIHDTGEAYRVEIYRWADNKFVLALDVYPYPSREKLIQLKKQICGDRQFFNQYGIDFSSIKYISSETEKDMHLEQALVKSFDLVQDQGNVRYYYNKVDLNEDGKPEVFVYLVGSSVCGTGGCSGAIFKKENEDYILLSKFTLVNNPVIISNKKTKGYKDIVMNVSGGGIESFFALMQYNGTTYPSNPSIQPKIKPGTKLDGIAIISDDVTKNPGIELRNSNLINQAIIDVKVGNILGKHTNDKVVLVGSYLNKDSSFVENVDIVINPEKGGSPIITKIPYVGYNLELFLGDFNGDEKDEIMVRGEYGGSGGYAIAAIYEYKDGNLVEIFNPDMFSEKYKFIAKYLEDYKVLVQSLTLKEKYIFDISKTPKIYLNMIYDENGKAKVDEEPTVSAINGAFPIKIVFQKNYYLFIRQRVIGVSNADTIGYIESFVNLLDNEVKVVEMGAYQLGEK